MSRSLLNIFFTAALLALGSWRAEAAEKSDHETTLLVRNGYIVAPIYVYDHWRWLVVDTTQNLTTFHTTFTNHLVAVSPSVAEIMFNVPANETVYSSPGFFLAGNHPQPKYVLVSDCTPLEELCNTSIDGILGLNVLTNYAITFDFATEKVRFVTNAAAAREGISLRVEGGNSFTFAATLGNEKHIQLAIDTFDRGEIALSRENWDKTFPNGPAKTKQITVADRSGKFERTIQARLPYLKIGEQVYTNLLCRKCSHAMFSSIGAHFLQRHRVTIDYPKRKLLLELVADAKPAEENVTGIHLKWIRRMAIIASIDPESAAEQSGLVEGDQILRIAGRSVPRMKISEIEEQFARGDNWTLEIEALHGPKEVTKKLVLKHRL
jgi:hypothetical protein